MKMLGFMIALTLVYWLMASFAQNVVTSSAPCPASMDVASAGDLGKLLPESGADKASMFVEASLAQPEPGRGRALSDCAS